MNKKLVAAGFLAAMAVMALPVGGATDPGQCLIETTPALALKGYYVRGTLYEVWQETNGIPGLQLRQSACIGGGFLAPDACVLSTDAANAAPCSNAYVGAL